MLVHEKIIALGLVLVALWGFHEYDKAQAVKAVRTEYQNKSKEYAERTERATKALEASLRSSMKAKDEKIKTIDSELSVAIERLRHRKPRPVDIKTVTITEACTGAQLFREDGEFLAGEAARADKVMAERDFYYERYEDARKELDDLRSR
jgi:hypothetical protein